MASFRVRTPAEYLRLLWRRRYFILTPFVIAGAALCWAVHGLPNIYESTAMIIVVPPRVSSNYVQPVNQVDVDSRLSAIQKQVTSRTELQRIINRFGLYKEMIEGAAPVELVIDEMRRHIFVRSQRAPTGTNAFTISFQDAEPRTARDVTAELAARFIDANSDETRREAYTTIDQLDDFSGEAFRIQDPANLPDVPVSPKRRLLYPLSLIIGMLTGLIAAIAIESRAMMTIRDSKDVAHYARLPLLVTVPKIVTAEERRMRPLVNTAKVLAVLLLIAAAVPLLYQAIKASRLLNVLTGG